MKTPKCPCCNQRSNLRKAECVLCGAYIMASRAQFRDGLHPCRCGQGNLEPVCLLDRAELGGEAGFNARAEFNQRFQAARYTGFVDPQRSSWSKKAAATRKAREARALIRCDRTRYAVLTIPQNAEGRCPAPVGHRHIYNDRRETDTMRVNETWWSGPNDAHIDGPDMELVRAPRTRPEPATSPQDEGHVRLDAIGGSHEAATLAGIKQHSIHYHTVHNGFPAPMKQLKGTRLFDLDAVSQWAATRRTATEARD